jgi:glycerol kinase
MTEQSVTRREFVREATAMTAAAAAGVAATAGPRTIVAANAKDVPPEVQKTRSYNPNMEYRRLGKTGLWVSAVCLGGHWKRVDKVISSRGTIDPYRGPQADGDMGPFL